MSAPTFRLKYAAIRKRALKLARRSPFSQENAGPSSISFPNFISPGNHFRPSTSLSESAESSGISGSDYHTPSSKESSSNELDSKDSEHSQTNPQGPHPPALPAPCSFQIPAVLGDSNIPANDDYFQFLSDSNVDCWDNGNDAECEDGPYCLSAFLRAATDDALQAFTDMLRERSLNDSTAIEAYLAQCSIESLQDFFVTVIDAKNAATLRRFAALHDVDYLLQKLTPFMKLYHSDLAALGSIEESINLVRKETNKSSHRYVDLSDLENRLPGDTRHSPSFLYTNQASQAKIEEHRQRRPRARYFSRQFIEGSCAVTDRDFISFYEN